MKKLIASILSAVMLISMAGCGNRSSSGNPVKKNEDGSIDMKAALKYETDFEKLEKELSEREVDVNLPVSLNARKNPNTMKVWELLRSVYGKQIISGQMQFDLNNTYEDRVYYNATEDLPALKGFDFIFTTTGEDGQNREFVDAAIEWGTKSGGLVTFCWHWNVPRDIDNPSLGKAFYKNESSTNALVENFDVMNATTPGTKEYEVAVHDIDLIASYLQELEEAGVTVLWRPFHEASGSWFWWGIQPGDRDAREKFRRLWYMMYDRLENYHKLSNLIWVWNGQSATITVDPNSYDISGIDVYPSKEDHSPLVTSYNKLNNYTYKGKMLALTETGYIPDPDQCLEQDRMWLFYMPWNGGFIYETTDKKNSNSAAITDFYGTPNPNPDRITNELLKQYFSSDVMFTWNDLADISETHEIPQALKLWNYYKNAANE